MKPRHIPVHIITGFLGCGKTTLLNRILQESHGKKIAVIVNEFGEVGLDASLIENHSQDFVEMANGCLCCALNEDLVKTLKNLSERNDYDAVVLETTGVADPLPIVWTFYREAYQGYFRFGGIVTVIDTLHFLKMEKQAKEVKLQAERADFFYLAKTDLGDPSTLTQVKKRIYEINPNARLVSSEEAGWIDLIFDFESKKNISPNHLHHDHSAAYDNLAFSFKGIPVNLDQVEDFFEALPPQVFRAKAVFCDSQTKQNYVMHGVCGRIEFFPLQKARVQSVVLIGKNFDQNHLKKLFKDYFS